MPSQVSSKRKARFYVGLALSAVSGATLVLLAKSRVSKENAWVAVAVLILISGVVVMAQSMPTSRGPGYYRKRWLASVIILPIVAFFSILYGSWNLVEGRASLRWPQIQGVVLSTRVTRHYGRYADTYTPDIAYCYQVAGTTYTAHRVAFPGPSFHQATAAQAIIDRFPAGKAIPVFYSPDLPGRSVLEPGTPGNGWVLPSLGVGLLSVAVFLFFKKPGFQ